MSAPWTKGYKPPKKKMERTGSSKVTYMGQDLQP
jgi:hypothetical protein